MQRGPLAGPQNDIPHFPAVRQLKLLNSVTRALQVFTFKARESQSGVLGLSPLVAVLLTGLSVLLSRSLTGGPHDEVLRPIMEMSVARPREFPVLESMMKVTPVFGSVQATWSL